MKMMGVWNALTGLGLICSTTQGVALGCYWIAPSGRRNDSHHFHLHPLEGAGRQLLNKTDWHEIEGGFFGGELEEFGYFFVGEGADGAGAEA